MVIVLSPRCTRFPFVDQRNFSLEQWETFRPNGISDERPTLSGLAYTDCMKSLRSLPLIVPLLGLYACSSPAGSRVDSGGGDTAAPADTGPDLVAPGMKCTGDINLSCFNFMAAVPNCSEYANADDAKIAEVTASCASVQGDLALGKCPPGNTAGCGYSTEVPCRHLWYYGFPTDLLQQVCGSNLILP